VERKPVGIPFSQYSAGWQVRLGRRYKPGCSDDQAIEDGVDCEPKPLVAGAGNHLRGVGCDEREPLGRQAGKVR
jgi:hypothetical protein